MNAPNRIIDLGIWAIETAQAWALGLQHAYNGAEAAVVHAALRRGGVVTPEDVDDMAVVEFCDVLRIPQPVRPVVELLNTCDGCGAVDEYDCTCWCMNDAPSGWYLKGAW